MTTLYANDFGPGIPLGASLVPGSASQGALNANLLTGGFLTVPSLADRDAIPVDLDEGLKLDGLSSGRRQVGMVVSVTEDEKRYELKIAGFQAMNEADKLTALADNANWSEFVTSAQIDTSDFATMSGQNNFIGSVQVPYPQNPDDAATKSYVDTTTVSPTDIIPNRYRTVSYSNVIPADNPQDYSSNNTYYVQNWKDALNANNFAAIAFNGLFGALLLRNAAVNANLYDAIFTNGLVPGLSMVGSDWRFSGGNVYEMYLMPAKTASAEGRGHSYQISWAEYGDLAYQPGFGGAFPCTYTFNSCKIGYVANGGNTKDTLILNSCIFTGTRQVVKIGAQNGHDIFVANNGGTTYINNGIINVPVGFKVVTGYSNTITSLRTVPGFVWTNVLVILSDNTHFVLNSDVPIAPKKTAYMFVEGGQSNELGKNDVSQYTQSPLKDVFPSPLRKFQDVYIWSPTASAFQNFENGVNGLTYENSVGLTAGVAQRWVQDNPTTPLYVVKCPVDGAHITRWDKATGDLYATQATAINAAKTSLLAQGFDEVRTIAYYWSQGEVDGSDTNYAQELSSYFSNLLVDNLIQPTTVQLISECHWAGATTVADAQRAYVNSTPNARLIKTVNKYAMMSDNLHYTALTLYLAGAYDVWNAISGKDKPYPFNFDGSDINFISTDLKNAVVTGAYSGGELQGAQPPGSKINAKFSDATYLYQCSLAMADVDGTSFAWSRTRKE